MKIITCTDGTKLRRISRWIKLQCNLAPNSRNSLWNYACDGSGYHPYQDRFNPGEGLYLDYFRFRGRTYALEQFFVLGGMWTGGKPYFYKDDYGLHTIATVDMDGPIFGPALYGEWDEYCEHVRLYEEVRE